MLEFIVLKHKRKMLNFDLKIMIDGLMHQISRCSIDENLT